MHKRTTPKIFARAKELHRNMSPAEAKLWQHLRAHRMGDVHFRNQHAIGNYIVDFCAPRKKLIIELDGSQHLAPPALSGTLPKYDRKLWLMTKSAYRIWGGKGGARFWNNDVMQEIETVLQVIWSALNEARDKKTTL
jgi:very-short-patch-repair endonuclease